jgi:acyl carrier protein
MPAELPKGVIASNVKLNGRDKSPIKDQLASFIVSEFSEGKSAIGPDDDLIKQGIVDSMGVLQIAAFIEETYGASIGDEEITVEYFKSISAIARLVEEKVGAAR